MSMRLMGMAFKSGIPTGQRFVLVKMCEFGNDEGICYPSQETIAEDTGMSETSVYRHIQWLISNNFIKKARRQNGRKRKSDIYRINIALLEKLHSEAVARKAEKCAKAFVEPSEFDDLEPCNLEPCNLEPCNLEPMNLSNCNHEPFKLKGSLYEEPSVEPSVEPSELSARTAQPADDNPENGDFAKTETAETAKPEKRKRADRHQADLALLAGYGIAGQVAEDWLTIRKAKRQLLTKTALELLQSEAAKCGMTAEQAVLYAIGNGWAGFRAEYLQNRAFSGAANSVKPNRINDIPEPMKGGAYLAKDVF